MSTWASRISKSATSSPALEGRSGTRRHHHHHEGSPGASSSSCAAMSPIQLGPATTMNNDSSDENVMVDVREEFRRVAEKYNEESAVMLQLPADCWDTLTQFLPYTDVIALGQACRSLWLLLHTRESVWWRQLAYFHADVRDLRGGKLLCTAPLFPTLPEDAPTSTCGSLMPSPTTAPPPSSSLSAALAADRASSGRPLVSRSRRDGGVVSMSAYERFLQERRVYVLDAHREWHFQELAEIEDKATGMFTVALHEGRIDSGPSPQVAEGPNLSFASSTSPPPALLPRTTASANSTPGLAPMMGSARDASLDPPPSPLSLTSPSLPSQPMTMAPPAPPSRPAAPTPPHRRTASNLTPVLSAGNSPALAPAAAPSTPPLLPRVGEPIINDHNPRLTLRVYTIDTRGGAQRGGVGPDDANASADGVAAAGGSLGSRATPPVQPQVNFAAMTEEQVMEYVMQLSLQEAQEAARTSTPPAEPAATAVPTAADGRAAVGLPHTHYRGAAGSASLPLSDLLTIVDSINNNAVDQLQRHQVRDCTADEDAGFLRRLAETLRSAKHRRLHLGNHHRAVRNNGQTTRNRAGRPPAATAAAAAADSAGFSVSNTSVAAGANVLSTAASPPPPPPPMNRMLRGFHGELLEITEREARGVAGKLLGKPNIIDDFVVFHCSDPGELFRRLQPPPLPRTDATPATSATANTLEAHTTAADRQVLKHGVLVSVPAPLYADPTVDANASSAASLSLSPATPAHPSASSRTIMRAPALKALPFYTRYFLAPELCHDGFFALLVVDVVRVLVVVDKEVVSTDNPDWASPLIDRAGRVVVRGQGYNAQAYTRDEYNYVPPNPPRRRRDSD